MTALTTAIYGGSFNPPHVGHAMVAAWLRWTGFDAVWLLPTYVHAFAKDLTPFEERVRWCEALASSIPGVQVCTIESELPVPSYTIDTLTELARRHPDRRFRLVVGADVAPQLPKWKQWDQIASDFAPIMVGRQGYPTPPGAIDFPPVSSTAIREALAAGDDVSHLVPAPVLDLLADHNPWGPKET